MDTGSSLFLALFDEIRWLLDPIALPLSLVTDGLQGWYINCSAEVPDIAWTFGNHTFTLPVQDIKLRVKCLRAICPQN